MAAPPAPPGGTGAVLALEHLVRRPVEPPPSGSRAPVLLLLHGIGGTEHALFPLRRAFAPEFVVVSPRGPVSVAGAAGGLGGKPHGPRAMGWFHVHDGPGGRDVDVAEARTSWELLPRFVAEVVEAYDGDPARVLLVGFSQGGIIATAALLTAPEAFAGVALMSGRLLDAALPHSAAPERLRGKPVLVLHGTEDPRVPVADARAARDWLARLPVALEYHEFPMRHVISDASRTTVATWAARVAGLADRPSEPPRGHPPGHPPGHPRGHRGALDG